jgi:D-tyrosyl-tRNA(Tyr) deacylase
VIQRIKQAQVLINGKETRSTGAGLLLLAGFCAGDNEEVVRYVADKIVNLRIFEDENGDMNRSLIDIGGELMVVSNFTLYANCRKGRRPSFIDAARPEIAIPLYEAFLAVLREGGFPVASGEFGAEMQVTLQNDGPVTIILDSEEILPKDKGGKSR